MKIASESGHWYDIDGNTAYEMPYADKKKGMRGTTLRDARKHNLFPSVTTVMNVAAKPGLERWKQTNLLMSALTLPKIDNESLDDFAKRCIDDSAETGKQAAQRGTDIHAVLESAYMGGYYSDDMSVYVDATMSAINEQFPNHTFEAEKSFTSPLYGYGGKVDLHSRHGNGLVIDFKTKEFSEDDKKLWWDDQAIQLAAYAMGLDMPDATLANVYISVSNPGLVKIHIWPEATEHYFQPFVHMLSLWQWTKQYIPQAV